MLVLTVRDREPLRRAFALRSRGCCQEEEVTPRLPGPCTWELSVLPLPLDCISDGFCLCGPRGSDMRRSCVGS